MSGDEETRPGEAADLDAELEAQLGAPDSGGGSPEDWADEHLDIAATPIDPTPPPRAASVEHVAGRSGAARPAGPVARAVRYVSARKVQATVALLAVALLGAVGWILWRQFAYIRPHTAWHGGFAHRWAAPAELSLPLSERQAARRRVSYRITRDGRFGLVRRIEAVDGFGEPAWSDALTPWLLDLATATPGDPRVTAIDYGYNEAGRLARATARDADGNVVYRARYSAIHDAEGEHPRRVMRMRFVDGHGNDTTSPLGAASVRIEHDARGRMTRVLNLDGDGEPHPQLAGDERSASTSVCGYVFGYDGSDHPVLTRFLGPDGASFVSLPQGYAQVRTDYDRFGRVTRLALLDADGQPAVRDGRPLPWERRAYDEAGNLAVIEQVDPRGEALPTDEGWWKQELTYGPHGRIVRDVRHMAPSASAAYARIVYDTAYDNAADTSTTTMRLRDDAGEAVRFGHGCMSIERTRDAQERLIRQRWAGFDAGRFGYAARVSTTRWKGDQRRSITTRYLDASGKPTRAPEGHTVTVQEVRESGGVWVTYGGFVPAEHGFSSAVVMYDAKGKRQAIRYLDADENVVGPVEVYVARVLNGGQAQRVGVRAGDVLAAVDGEPVVSALIFEPVIGEGGATLDARRDGQVLSYHVQPGPLGLVARDRVVRTE